MILSNDYNRIEIFEGVEVTEILLLDESLGWCLLVSGLIENLEDYGLCGFGSVGFSKVSA